MMPEVRVLLFQLDGKSAPHRLDGKSANIAQMRLAVSCPSGTRPCGRAAPMCRRSTCRGTSRTLGHRRACASLVASLAAGVAVNARQVLERIAPLHTGVPIATFRRDTPARRDAFADERRVVAGDGGGPMKADAKRSSSSIGEHGSSATLPTSAVEWPPTARGYRRSIRLAMLERGLVTPSSHRRSSPPSVALLPRVAARSSGSGASWPAKRTKVPPRLLLPGGRKGARTPRAWDRLERICAGLLPLAVPTGNTHPANL
jgi:hypothetical protein